MCVLVGPRCLVLASLYSAWVCKSSASLAHHAHRVTGICCMQLCSIVVPSMQSSALLLARCFYDKTQLLADTGSVTIARDRKHSFRSFSLMPTQAHQHFVMQGGRRCRRTAPLPPAICWDGAEVSWQSPVQTLIDMTYPLWPARLPNPRIYDLSCGDALHSSLPAELDV